MQGEPSGICRTSPVEFLQLTRRLERQARVARAAAMGDIIVRAFAAATRGVRLVASIVIARSQIDERVRLAAKRYVRPNNSSGLI